MVAGGAASPRASHGAVSCGSLGSSLYRIGGEPSDCRASGGSMSEYEFTISLRIRHPSIDPATVTRVLGMEPQHTWQAGAARRGPAGEALEGIYRETYWMGRLMEEPQLSSGQVSVESVLLQTLAHLRRSQDFLEQLHAEGGVAELYVTLFAREDFRLELSAQSLALLGRLGLAVALDVHPQPSQGLSQQQAS
jgi:hypothetical protein